MSSNKFGSFVETVIGDLNQQAQLEFLLGIMHWLWHWHYSTGTGTIALAHNKRSDVYMQVKTNVILPTSLDK